MGSSVWKKKGKSFCSQSRCWGMRFTSAVILLTLWLRKTVISQLSLLSAVTFCVLQCSFPNNCTRACVYVLRMDSPAASGHSFTPLTVNLLSFFTHGDSLFLQVETTAPPPRRSFRRKKKLPTRSGTCWLMPYCFTDSDCLLTVIATLWCRFFCLAYSFSRKITSLRFSNW